MKRILLLLPTTGYRNNDFLAAAKTFVDSVPILDAILAQFPAQIDLFAPVKRGEID